VLEYRRSRREGNVHVVIGIERGRRDSMFDLLTCLLRGEGGMYGIGVALWRSGLSRGQWVETGGHVTDL
jgi:hypothetical protein